jgi:hypothetical protein
LGEKSYCLESSIYGLKKNAAALGLPPSAIERGCRPGMPMLTKEVLEAWKAGQQ